MIHFIAYDNLDFKKWDNCIEHSFNATFYASSWYLNIVCEQWDALVLDDYEAVIPLPRRKMWGVKYIYQPFLCQQLGVFYTHHNFEVDDFISAIPKRFLQFTINLNSFNSQTSYTTKKNTNDVLSLNDNIDVIRDKYSASHLKNLKRANKQKLSIASRCDTEEEFSKNKGLLASDFMTPKQLELELKIIQASIAVGKGEIFSVKGENGNCCSIFLMKDKKSLYLLSSYSNVEGRKKSAYFFLLDYIFSLERFRGYVFDFEGSNLEGVAQRNKGFGAVPTNYYTIHQSIWKGVLSFLS